MKFILLLTFMVASLSSFASDGVKLLDSEGQIVGVFNCKYSDANEVLGATLKNITVKEVTLSSKELKIILNKNIENIDEIIIDKGSECQFASNF